MVIWVVFIKCPLIPPSHMSASTRSAPRLLKNSTLKKCLWSKHCLTKLQINLFLNVFSWVLNLDKFFARRNMTVLAKEYYPIRDSIAHPWTLMQLMTIAEQIRMIDPPRESVDDWWKGYKDAAEEVAQGVSIRTDMIVTVGRKHGASWCFGKLSMWCSVTLPYSFWPFIHFLLLKYS